MRCAEQCGPNSGRGTKAQGQCELGWNLDCTATLHTRAGDVPDAGEAFSRVACHYPGRVPSPVLLSDLTTLRLGGPAPDLTTALTAQDVVDAVGAADRQGTGVLVLGGGSNLVIADEGIDVPIVRIGIRGIRIERAAADGAASVTIGAGENWDDVVAELTAAGFAELATLSGIPGSTGATPVQNVGAYGTEIAEVLHSRHRSTTGRTASCGAVPAAELALSYRNSVLRGTDAAVITDITLRLSRSSGRPALRRTGQGAGRRARRDRSAGRRSAGRARSAPRQGHGARPDGPRHLQRRFVLHQSDPGRRPRRAGRPCDPEPTRCGRRLSPVPRHPAGPRRGGQAVGGLADRAGRFPEGLPRAGWPGGRLQQTHPGADQSRRQHGRPDRAGRARSGTGCAARSG